MASTRLDPIDRKILAELQADGRMTNVELAQTRWHFCTTLFAPRQNP